MKYVVEIATTTEVKPEGPGPVIGRVVDRLKPEAVYTPRRRSSRWRLDLQERLRCHEDPGSSPVMLRRGDQRLWNEGL